METPEFPPTTCGQGACEKPSAAQYVCEVCGTNFCSEECTLQHAVEFSD